MSTAPAAPAAPLPILAAAAAPGARVLACGQSIHVLDLASHALRSSAPAGSLVRAVAVSPDGRHAAGATDDKRLLVWDLADLSVQSTRHTTKKVACLTFAPGGEIIFTDKTADVYRYPLEPRPVTGERPQGLVLLNDPWLNPDADLLLGHVSVVTQHVLSPDGRLILTADRDEHIRVSRYPRADVIERVLHLAEGFTSAMHIPPTHPELVLTAGSDDLHIFDYTRAHLPLASVPIAAHVKPHRRVRPTPRRVRGKRAASAPGPAPSDDPRDPGWYTPPEGAVLPLGDGLCVAGIESVADGADVRVAFFSLGCAAVHSFTLGEPARAAESEVHTLPLPHPVIGLIPLGETRLLVALDTAWAAKSGKGEVDVDAMRPVAVVIEISADGPVLVDSPLPEALAALPTAEPAAVAAIQLHADLTLLPRWPGMEEDDEMAGDGGEAGDASPAPSDEAQGRRKGKGKGKQRDLAREAAGMSAEQLAALDLRALGRLKAAGADVSELTSRKRRKTAAERAAAAGASEGAAGVAGAGGAAGAPGAVVDEEAAANV